MFTVRLISSCIVHTLVEELFECQNVGLLGKVVAIAIEQG